MHDQQIEPTVTLVREPEVQQHRIGRWTFETRGDELANIRLDGRPVLRAVRFVVRDRDWRTIPVASTRLLETPHGGTGVLRLRAQLTGGGVSYGIELSVVGEGAVEKEVLTVQALGTAGSAFQRNRIGLVVLHHPDDAGSLAEVTSPDGGHRVSAFPIVISPHQPFRDIAAFSWERSGMPVGLEFDGDVFEMEDQRNWTDASFKTYSTPLDLPFPVEVQVGDEVRNELRIVATAEHRRLGIGPADPSTLVVEPLAEPVALPSLSTLVHGATDPVAVAALGLVELTAELDTRRRGWREELARVVQVAEQAGLGLDLRLVVEDLPLDVIEGLRYPVVRLGVFDAANHLTEATAQAIVAGVLAEGIELVTGTRAHFTELNRNHERLDLTRGSVVFSTTPQMHATELRPILETVGTLPLIADAAHAIARERPVRVGPVTVEPRFNAVATSAESPVDPIGDHSDLGAHPALPVWLIASVIGFAHPAVVSLCISRADGIGALLNGATPTPAGRTIALLTALRGPIAAIGRNEQTIAAVIGDRLIVVDLSGRAETKRLVVDGKPLDLWHEKWEISSRYWSTG